MSNQLTINTNPDWSHAQVALIQQQIAPGCSLQELELFGQVCRRTGLDPFSRQIYAVSRGSKGNKKMTIQVSIDGFRLQADRSKRYGGSESFWCGTDGEWCDVWLSAEPPAAAKVTVYRTGCEKPFTAIALWSEYKQEVPEYSGWGDNRKPTGRKVLGDMWAKMPATMLEKCAEAKALRKAFPAELSGLYTSEEMMQADAPETAVVVHATPQDSRPKLPASAVVSETGEMPDFLKQQEPSEADRAAQERVNSAPVKPAKHTPSPAMAKAKPVEPSEAQNEFAAKLLACQIDDATATEALARLMGVKVNGWRSLKDKQLSYTMGEGWEKFSAAVVDVVNSQEAAA